MKHFITIAPLALLAACSFNAEPDPAPADETETAAPAQPAEDQATAPDKTAPAKPAPADKTAASPNILTLAGLGDLRIGQPVPEGSSWSAEGAQASDSCVVLGSPDYPGAYAITEGGKVRRISIGKRSKVKLIEGIGPGATEAEVKDYFAFPATPHHYVEAPGKYLTAPNAKSGESALRFEIDSDGKVSQIHVGTMPTLAYVEACS
ncbi:hypothetical protein [Parasphingorhabdus sp.]|uniref:hypothetical protein n=1 Tax=Parasphingorhabdus sp. TaxID=2709688 RepID=UPI003A944687